MQTPRKKKGNKHSPPEGHYLFRPIGYELDLYSKLTFWCYFLFTCFSSSPYLGEQKEGELRFKSPLHLSLQPFRAVARTTWQISGGFWALSRPLCALLVWIDFVSVAKVSWPAWPLDDLFKWDSYKREDGIIFHPLPWLIAIGRGFRNRFLWVYIPRLINQWEILWNRKKDHVGFQHEIYQVQFRERIKSTVSLQIKEHG